MPKQLFVLSAPSGGGKTTVARHLLATFPNLRFSVSATTRMQRPGEIHGKDYFFLSKDEFSIRINQGDLLEYEVIFGNYYGTLRSEVRRILESGESMIFDVDVKGALSLRRAFPDESLLMFIAPPSMDALEKRLRSRQTESAEQIALRLERAAMEMQSVDFFDEVIINDILTQTLDRAEEVVRMHIDT
ncbi:MAG: guanylate kinase [Ignavibacteria bacterium]|nr:guanylate kinase [Ignavibacteria bacterium]